MTSTESLPFVMQFAGSLDNVLEVKDNHPNADLLPKYAMMVGNDFVCVTVP